MAGVAIVLQSVAFSKNNMITLYRHSDHLGFMLQLASKSAAGQHPWL
ncbi:hypothetical protein PENANT_c069G08618 [Penicillium antarcticum]|uniref:Uncharacterized protein n=1 Tax=Penicillium antarcticum TaxID=416450 RepID=A0A1V6NUW4_9EURO|nr:hypothetical protein PENANT_c309G01385 [Penicillium antarcticum]OQD78963.1 hypothetical protein PENANT_c069G08618 [Penicillium antarcticum]